MMTHLLPFGINSASTEFYSSLSSFLLRSALCSFFVCTFFICRLPIETSLSLSLSLYKEGSFGTTVSSSARSFILLQFSKHLPGTISISISTLSISISISCFFWVYSFPFLPKLLTLYCVLFCFFSIPDHEPLFQTSL